MRRLFSTPHKAFFITRGQEESGSDYLIQTDQYDKEINLYLNEKQKDIQLKRYVAAKYFLEKTNYSWLWSSADDTIITVEKLDTIIQDLNYKYDTNSDLVLLGHCFSYEPWGDYPQGGIG